MSVGFNRGQLGGINERGLENGSRIKWLFQLVGSNPTARSNCPSVWHLQFTLSTTFHLKRTGCETIKGTYASKRSNMNCTMVVDRCLKPVASVSEILLVILESMDHGSSAYSS